jgi:hypothetical protein
MDGRAYLEKFIADRLRQDRVDRSEIRGVAIGLVAAGALPQQELEQVLADLDETLQIVRRHGSASIEIGPMAVARRVGVERPEWRQAIEDPPTPVLRDVVPLVDRTVVVGDVTADLISLEVWSTFVGLNLAIIGLEPHQMRHRFGPYVRWRGWDDVGTQYQGTGGGASGLQGLFVARYVLTPGPPQEARALTIVIEHPGGQSEFSVPLA